MMSGLSQSCKWLKLFAGREFPGGGTVADAQGEVADELSRIAREFPGWRPWVSDSGRCWATRGGRQPVTPPEWWAMTVDADDPDGLRQAIAEQETLAHPVGAT
jgi:hypothetical protein